MINSNKNNNKNNFKVCSLFSGCGGLDLGFKGGFTHNNNQLKLLPFDIVFANDVDKDAVNIYMENIKYFGNHKILLDDIRNVDPQDVGDFDVLLAGFPCQPFSNAGNRKGVYDSRGTLFEEVFRFISSKPPEIIIMENVKGILSTKMQNGNKVCTEIIDRLKSVTTRWGEQVSYNVSEPMLINSSHLGVPQNRERVIIIAIKSIYGCTPSKSDLFKFSIKFSQSDLLVKNILDYPTNMPNVDDVWALAPQQEKLVPHIKRSWKDIPYDLLPERLKRIRNNMKEYRSPNFFRRFNVNEINGTITASAQPENCGILHPYENRRYNVREIARIQSFPDDFTFNNASISQKYKVIGNAVPPVLAYTIASYCSAMLNNQLTSSTNQIQDSKQLSIFNFLHELQIA